MRLAAIGVLVVSIRVLTACNITVDDEPQLPPDYGPSALITRDMYLYKPSGPTGGVGICIIYEPPEGDCYDVVPETVTDIGFNGRIVVVRRKSADKPAGYYIFDMVEDADGGAVVGPLSESRLHAEGLKRHLPPLKPIPQLKVGPPWPPSEI